MDSSTIFQAPPQAEYFLWSCNKVYHKQEVCLGVSGVASLITTDERLQ